MQPKPATCAGCPLEKSGWGWVPPSGPPASRVLFVGESPGRVEAQTGVPFVGPAGGKFNHFLYRLGRSRDDYRVHNVISCRPPNDKLEKTPYGYDAIAHCRPNLDHVLNEGHRVIVAFGAAPTKRLLGLSDLDMKNFHGTVTKTPAGWVVPTFHPSHILRGAHNLTGTVIFALHRAFDIADNGWEEDHPSLVVDPEVAWFAWWVESYLQAVEQDPESVWLAVDIETPDKERKGDEGELKSTDRSMEITRINFSFDPNEGLTVPFVGPYLHYIALLLGSAGPKLFWNKPYDLKRLRPRFTLGGALLDFMDAWHVLHSDVPKGLGFVAPHYSRWGPWKHLSATNPGLYGAGDGLQTTRCGFGIAGDLYAQGMWNVFWRHMYELDRYATSLSCEVGLKIDRAQLDGPDGMRDRLREKAKELHGQMQLIVPEELKPLHPKDGWKTRPAADMVLWPNEGEDGSRMRAVLTKIEQHPTRVCLTCGALQIPERHRCKNEKGKPAKDLVAKVENRITAVERYYVREDFNPWSWQQVLAYIKHCRHKPGHERGKETTNRETIERLAEGKPRNQRDAEARELYHGLLDYRDVKKVLGTYVEGILRRLDESPDDRVHPVVNNNPSMQRTAYNSPNLQNVVADKRGKESLSAGFRNAVIAEPGCKLVEIDWSGIEAVIVGWLCGDPDYIRLAWLGVHDFLCSHAVGAPASLTWPVDELLAYFAKIKELHEAVRDQCKRIVHGTNYLETVEGIYKRFRKLFRTIHEARKLQELYYSIAPKLKPWQITTQDLAYKQEYLGGPGAHPFGYRHEFYNVRDFRLIDEREANRCRRLGLAIANMNGRWYRVSPGEDAKRAVADGPQSIAAGVIRETGVRLFKPDETPNYIGEEFFGRTPLRAIIHDSFLLEVPDARVERVIERTAAEMTRPIVEMPLPAAWGLGEYLQFGVVVKVGKDWAHMEKVKVPQPWLGVLKGNGAVDLPVDLEDRAVVDEREDDEEESEWDQANYTGA